MSNPYKRLVQLIPGQPIDTGTVTAVRSDGVTVQLLDGTSINVRGTASVSDVVYIRNGAVDGPAPDLTGTTIEV